MHIRANQKIECALYVVATPIGNLGDITLRALDVLGAVGVVAAEDTRNTRHLLQHHGIGDAKLLALHQHNERAGAEKIVTLLQQGNSVALVTDAGTPAVSDPGALLVEAVRAAGFRVIPIPGASAAIAALSASGLVNPHFLFHGFLPNKSAARRAALQSLADLPCTLVFYEAPHRILECVTDLHAVFGDAREIVFARELTKLFESIHRCPLGTALAWLHSDPNNQRGEFVLLVSGAAPRNDDLDAQAERVLAV
ncbi:MAG: 16S rRNA (cytidine(1402)-2'-O)-methyltransferase, partial [Gallionella sp.]|nr:16S rRNA (cytidine(1402)-2'-O)-methyltransferase [Gallionella sp.]